VAREDEPLGRAQDGDTRGPGSKRQVLNAQEGSFRGAPSFLGLLGGKASVLDVESPYPPRSYQDWLTGDIPDQLVTITQQRDLGVAWPYLK
jgi:hypothetical protein